MAKAVRQSTCHHHIIYHKRTLYVKVTKNHKLQYDKIKEQITGCLNRSNRKILMLEAEARITDKYGRSVTKRKRNRNFIGLRYLYLLSPLEREAAALSQSPPNCDEVPPIQEADADGSKKQAGSRAQIEDFRPRVRESPHRSMDEEAPPRPLLSDKNRERKRRETTEKEMVSGLREPAGPGNR